MPAASSSTTSWRTSTSSSSSDGPRADAPASRSLAGRLARRLPRRLRGLAVLHPFPSFLNAAVVAVLAWMAGGGASAALALAVSMFLLQAAIGAFNDVVDAPDDARVKPGKPIPRGYLTVRTAAGIAATSAATGVVLAAVLGPEAAALAGLLLATGALYSLVLKRTAFAGLAFSVSFTILPVFAWLPMTGVLPPRPELLLPLAALAGPVLQLANGLVDLERDRSAGVRGPAVRLGRERTVVLLAITVGAIHAVAWASLLTSGSGGLAPLAASAAATGFAALGLALSASRDPDRRERGWQAQATAVALLAGGWLVAAAG